MGHAILSHYLSKHKDHVSIAVGAHGTDRVSRLLGSDAKEHSLPQEVLQPGNFTQLGKEICSRSLYQGLTVTLSALYCWQFNCWTHVLMQPWTF